MSSTPDRGGQRSGGRWKKWRGWAILIGALILLVVVFDLLERLVPPDAPSAADVAPDPATPLEPIRPELTRLGSTGVRLEVEGGNRITQHLDNEAQADRLIACLEEGIATSPAFAEGEAGQPPHSDSLLARRVRAEQVWNEAIRIHNGCAQGP